MRWFVTALLLTHITASETVRYPNNSPDTLRPEYVNQVNLLLGGAVGTLVFASTKLA